MVNNQNTPELANAAGVLRLERDGDLVAQRQSIAAVAVAVAEDVERALHEGFGQGASEKSLDRDNEANDTSASLALEGDERHIETKSAPEESVGSTERRAAPVDRNTAQREIARLAKLNKLDYERERKSAADRLGMRASALDEFVEQARGTRKVDGQGQELLFDDIEPADLRSGWPTCSTS